MNRRSALIAAAGIVVTLVIAAVAVFAGLVGPDEATANVRARDRTPHVRTVTTTVTVHKPGGTVTVSGDGFDATGDDDDGRYTDHEEPEVDDDDGGHDDDDGGEFAYEHDDEPGD